MSEIDVERAAPWIRLAGAVLVGFALVELVEHVTLAMLLAWAHQAERDVSTGTGDTFQALDRRDEAYRLLAVVSTSNLGLAIARGLCTASVLAVVAWRASRERLLAGASALAFAASTAYGLHLFVTRFLMEGPEAPPSEGWYRVQVVAELLAWGTGAALVRLRTRGGPWRRVALGCVLVAGAAALLRFGVSPLVLDTPAWWKEPLLGLRASVWTSLVGTGSLGVGAWLAGAPSSVDEARRFDAAAARGLRLARTAMGWRIAVAMGAVVLMLAGASAQRSAQPSAMLVGGSEPASGEWMLSFASGLGLVEVALGFSMVMGLGAAVLQRRSRPAAALAGAGAVLLLLTLLGGFALDRTLHAALRGNLPGLGTGFGDGDVRDYVELVLAHEAKVRWLGLVGLGTVLAGLVVLARAIGRPSVVRALRFLALAVLFTATWQWGRQALAELGMGVLLLTPVVLGAAVWMLLDLLTFLGEVADALEAEPPPTA